MKKIKYVLIMLVVLMGVISCSDDDDDNDDMGNAIVGTWKFQESEVDYEFNLTITFNENLTGQMTVIEIEDGDAYTESDSFTWSTSGNQLTLIIYGESETETYAISGNKLTIGEVGDTIVLIKQ